MAQAYFSLITNAGKIKLAQSAAGGAAVVITHFAIGDGNGADTNPTAASTALVREVWRTPVESVATDPDNPSAILVTAIIPTQVGGWWMREFGIFDQAGSMIAVAKPVSQYKPTAQEGQLEDIRYEFQIVIGENANVTLLVDPSILLASREWVMSRKIPMAQMTRLPWLAVNSMTVTAPPASPAQGDAYLVPAGATGAWAANIGRIAEWSGTAWSYAVPTDGHGIGLPDGRIFERVGGAYVEFLASRDWVNTRIAAVTKLNRLPWLAVNSMTVTAPPASSAQGDAYLVPAGATGAWAANIGQIAEWSGTAWSYAVPSDGHGIALPDGRIFERIGGAYVEKLALDAQSGKWNYAIAGGTANALTATLSPAPASLASLIGSVVALKIVATNPGAVTLNMNGFGPVPVRMLGGADILPNQLVAGIVVLTYDGATWQVLSVTPSIFSRGGYQWFVNSASFTVPPGVFFITAECVGGGGGGGGTSTTGAAATGGNGGARGIGRYAVTPGQVIPVTVGQGGAAAAAGAQNGFAGGASSFGSMLTANGGFGGVGSGGGIQTIIQANATVSGANILASIGSQSQPAYRIGATLVCSPGGPPPQGAYTDRAGYDDNSPVAGVNATQLGQGGGGGLGGSAPGGRAAGGYVIINY